MNSNFFIEKFGCKDIIDKMLLEVMVVKVFSIKSRYIGFVNVNIKVVVFFLVG